MQHNSEVALREIQQLISVIQIKLKAFQHEDVAGIEDRILEDIEQDIRRMLPIFKGIDYALR